MPLTFLHYIIIYGYFAIFLIVFLQEIGIPTIVPNEISLFFFGYLAYQGNIRLELVLITSICGEISGTSLVYLLFYSFGPFLSHKRLKWIPIPHKTINRLKEKIDRRGKWGIFIGRMTPFLRGYTSVLAGLLRVRPKRYLLICSASALCSTGGLVLAGWFLGPYWNLLSAKIPNLQNIPLLIIAILIFIRLIIYSIKKIVQKNLLNQLNKQA
jgi:membrane protein DedA with SNARE-associated domain